MAGVTLCAYRDDVVVLGLRNRPRRELRLELIKPIIELFSNGQIQEAFDTLETLIKKYPNQPILFNICGVFYKQIGQLDEAIKRFEKACYKIQKECVQY